MKTSIDDNELKWLRQTVVFNQEDLTLLKIKYGNLLKEYEDIEDKNKNLRKRNKELERLLREKSYKQKVEG